jgi:hypothetical protein
MGAHVGLQVAVVGAEFGCQVQHRRKVGDALRVALRLPGHAVCAQETGHVAGIAGIDEADAGAVEAGIADYCQLLVQRPFDALGAAPLHGPEGSIDGERLRHIWLPR